MIKHISFRYCRWGGVILLFAALPALAYDVAILKTLSNPSMDSRQSEFINELKFLASGSDYELDIQSYDMGNDSVHGQQMLGEIRENAPDMLVTIATKATATAWSERDALVADGVDSFFFFVSDPVGMGIVDQVGQSTGYPFTGLVNVMDRFDKTQLVLDLLRQVDQGDKRVLLLHSDYPASKYDAQLLSEVAEEIPDLTFVPMIVHFDPEKATAQYIDEINAAIKAQSVSFDYIWVGLGPLGRNRDYLNAVLDSFDEPVVCSSDIGSVKAGALMTVTSNAQIDGRAAAIRVDRILRGLDEASAPVERTPSFVLALNLTTASDMGIVVPSRILKLAEGHIYR